MLKPEYFDLSVQEDPQNKPRVLVNYIFLHINAYFGLFFLGCFNNIRNLLGKLYKINSTSLEMQHWCSW